MNIYDKNGYLNVPLLSRLADRNNTPFILIVGPRQVGKTYGTFKLMLDEERSFILLRRTQAEVEFLSNDELNPFNAIDQDIHIKRDSQYTAAIMRDYEDESTQIGLATSLTGIAKIRGFSGAKFTDLVFDEMIPELHVMRIRNEGDAFVNAIITIGGNRELEGLPPLRCWMLANSNNVGNPILAVLGVQEKLTSMIDKGQELSILSDRGIMIVNAKAKTVTNKRRNIAIFRAIDKDSRVARMALKNEFAYNDPENVRPEDLKQYDLICSVMGAFSLWRSKHTYALHVDKKVRKCSRMFADTKRGHVEFIRTYPDLKRKFINKEISFSDLVTKENFVEIIDFKK